MDNQSLFIKGVVYTTFAVGILVNIVIYLKMGSKISANRRSIKAASYAVFGAPEPEPELSEKTKTSLQEAIEKKDTKTEKWIQTSIKKGYEGAGVIFYVVRDEQIFYVLGINKKNEAEYPGGKCEDDDTNIESTVAREVLEETGLFIEKNRFVNKCPITGGTTGYPSYVFFVKITEEEFSKLHSKDGTFSKFITVDNIIDCEKVKDSDSGTEYELRKFNRKYVIPQIKDSILNLIVSQIPHTYDWYIKSVLRQIKEDKIKNTN